MDTKNRNRLYFAEKILRQILPDKIINTAIGDYEEIFTEIYLERGSFAAQRWIIYQILMSLFPFVYSTICWRATMLMNYLKFAIRNLKRNKVFSSITISSLSVGVACSMMIFIWVKDELSFDKFHKNYDSLYRVITETEAAGQIYRKPAVPTPLVVTIQDEYPEILNTCRFRGGFTGWLVRYGEKSFINDRVGMADPSFFEMFSFKFLEGDPKTALNERYSIIITEDMAKKYFDDEKSLGKQLILTGTRTAMTVKGVIENIPKNSHLQFDFLIPIENMDYWWSEDFNNWERMRFNAYVQLIENTEGAEFSQKISDIVKRHYPETAITRTYLQRLKDVHFDSEFSQDEENFGKGNKTYVLALSALAVILILIACINYINLSTARSIYRSKEIGIRKTTGANRSDIIKQILVESTLLSFLTIVVSGVLIFLFLPIFSEISGKEFSYGYIETLMFLPILVGTGAAVCLLSSTYLAVIQSANGPIQALNKYINKQNSGENSLRRVLVVAQFSFSILFLISTFVIYSQLNYINNKDLGYNKDQIIYFYGPRGEMENSPESVKNELLQNPSILSVTYAYPPRSISWYTTDIDWDGKVPGTDHLINVQSGDYDYLKTFEIELVEGRYFSRDFAGDESNYLLSESAVSILGIKSPIGKRFTYRGELRSADPEGRIIGVVKDFHLGSLHNEIRPILIKFMPTFPFMCAKISPENIPGTIEFFENKWKEFGEVRPFSYTILDETINDFYRNERKIGQILKYFTFISGFIAFIGLFGLTIHIVEHKTREIGIRKVLGASVREIIIMLSRNLLVLIVIAAFIACPVGWMLMNNWLKDFAYRIELGPGIFIISLLISLFIALVTISYQTIRAGFSDPVKSLRNE